MSSANNSEKGRTGEDIAVDFLQSKGMAIIARNWRSSPYEVDIITRDGDMLVFVEVKLRKGNVFGAPQASVTIEKQKNLMRAANKYVVSKGIDSDVRFDIVAIVQDNNNITIDHIPNAFSIY